MSYYKDIDGEYSRLWQRRSRDKDVRECMDEFINVLELFEIEEDRCRKHRSFFDELDQSGKRVFNFLNRKSRR